MEPHCEPSRTVRFGPAGAGDGERGLYALDLETLELRHRASPVRIRPRAARVLAMLVRHEGRLVSCEVLRRELWGERHLEWRNGLHRCVRDLRRALEDDARRPRFVATVTHLGYRFVGERMPRTERDEAAEIQPAALLSWRRPSFSFAAGFATALLLPALLLLACLVVAAPR